MGGHHHLVHVAALDELGEEAGRAVDAALGHDGGVGGQAVPPVLAQVVLAAALHQEDHSCTHAARLTRLHLYTGCILAAYNGYMSSNFSGHVLIANGEAAGVRVRSAGLQPYQDDDGCM